MGGITSSERKARKNHAILEAMGGEPIWDSTKDESQIGSILNWYSQNKDNEEGRSWFVDYFRRLKKPETELRRIAKLPGWNISTHGYLARMSLLSEHVPEKFKTKLEEKYTELLSILPPDVVVEVKQKEVPNIQERIQEQVREYISEIEGWIDDFMGNGLVPRIESPLAWFKEQKIKPIQTQSIIDHYTEKNLQELTLAASGKDEQLAEAYSFLGERGLKKLISFIELIIKDAQSWYGTSKTISTLGRKVRVRKPKPAIKQIAKLKYMREYGQFKSIDPTEIVGAESLWVYNTKYRTLGVYVCSNPHGFSVKGCTILNFDESQSIGKKLRKPDQTIPQVISGGKVALRKLLPSIRAKEKKLTGRINKDTILLKALK